MRFVYGDTGEIPGLFADLTPILIEKLKQNRRFLSGNTLFRKG